MRRPCALPGVVRGRAPSGGRQEGGRAGPEGRAGRGEGRRRLAERRQQRRQPPRAWRAASASAATVKQAVVVGVVWVVQVVEVPGPQVARGCRQRQQQVAQRGPAGQRLQLQWLLQTSWGGRAGCRSSAQCPSGADDGGGILPGGGGGGVAAAVAVLGPQLGLRLRRQRRALVRGAAMTDG